MASIIDFIAGCFGGTAGVVVGHPLDTIKVRMQTSVKRVSMISLLRQTPITDLYRGITAPLTGLAVINAIVFGIYGSLMRNTSEPTVMWNAFAGTVAGVSQTVVTCPMELVKTRAQISSTTVSTCFLHLIRNEGRTRALYRGLTATICRDAPAFATYFTCYEVFIKMLSSGNPPSTWQMLLSGGCAGTASWLVVYPVDVVKSRIQADTKYSSIMDCMRQSYNSEGLRVFLKGVSPTLVRAFPSNAVTFSVVTWTLYKYEQYHSLRHNQNVIE